MVIFHSYVGVPKEYNEKSWCDGEPLKTPQTICKASYIIKLDGHYGDLEGNMPIYYVNHVPHIQALYNNMKCLISIKAGKYHGKLWLSWTTMTDSSIYYVTSIYYMI